MKTKLWIVTTVAESLDSLIEGQPRFLSKYFDVTIVSSPSKKLIATADRENVAWRAVRLTREISPIQDLISIWKMYGMLRKDRPDIIQSYTPKAGLITMISARLARVPLRVHGIVGMPLMEARGIRRKVMRIAEKLTYWNATALTSNSFGLRDYIRSHLTKRAIIVIGRGSINGVDVNHYDPQLFNVNVRSKLGIPEQCAVFVYVGRLVPDKGIVELVDAFMELANYDSNINLLLVGDEESELTPLPQRTLELIATSKRIRKLGWCADVRPYMAAANVFVLPSYREGLPNSVIEAGAMSLPSIVTDINGCNEVVQDGVNGILVPVKDHVKLREAMASLQINQDEAKAMGRIARARVIDSFGQEQFWGRLAEFYFSLVEEQSHIELKNLEN